MNFYQIGISVLVTMDIADILLPIAKVFRYINKQKISDYVYTIFFCMLDNL